LNARPVGSLVKLNMLLTPPGLTVPSVFNANKLLALKNGDSSTSESDRKSVFELGT
jgi:hypothetical protein